MSNKDKSRIFFVDDRAALYLQEQEELARRRLINGAGDARQDLESIAYISKRLKEADELQKKVNRYRRLLTAAKESVSEILNDPDI